VTKGKRGHIWMVASDDGMSQTPYSVEVHKERLFRHEFGHYVVARALGFRTGGIDILLRVEGSPPTVQIKGGSEVRLSQGIGDLEDLQRYLERRIAVLYSGACAGTLKPDLKVDSAEATKCLSTESDFAKALELIHLLRNVRYQATDCSDATAIQNEVDEIRVQLWTKAIKLVERYASTIILLAEKFKTNTVVRSSASALEARLEVQNIALVGDFDDL
jgi:hypothetical protein